MNRAVMKKGFLVVIFVTALLVAAPAMTEAVVDGITGPTFNLTAKAETIIAGDGDSIHMWGYANGTGPMQYPGPTLIVNQGSNVTVNLSNQLPVPVSIVFPGQNATATGGTPGLITQEAPPGGSVSYTFTASQPGTYMYYSGTRPELQVEMGLVGALIVRPTTGGANCPNLSYDPIRPSRGYAYCSPDAYFDREYLFLLTEIDPVIHQYVSWGLMDLIDNTTRYPVFWFINGRNLPDTMSPANDPMLPNQPYNILPMMHPGEKVLIRFIGGGKDPHPLHTHGNNFLTIARDGRLLSSNGTSPNLSESDFTHKSYPGETSDAIWIWTGEKLGWDVYGPIEACTDANHDGLDDSTGAFCHDATCRDVSPADGFDDATYEYCPDHGKSFPVALPYQEDLMFGMFYGGSPFLGALGALPPGEGGFNPWGAFFFMWHSHAEKELTNNDFFPGGMGTMAALLPLGVPIP